MYLLMLSAKPNMVAAVARAPPALTAACIQPSKPVAALMVRPGWPTSLAAAPVPDWITFAPRPSVPRLARFSEMSPSGMPRGRWPSTALEGRPKPMPSSGCQLSSAQEVPNLAPVRPASTGFEKADSPPFQTSLAALPS